MGATALAEKHLMVNDPLKFGDPPISAAAPATDDEVELLAAAAVADIDLPARVRGIGGSEKHAEGLKEAMRLALLGLDDEARAALQRAQYPDDAIDSIIAKLGEGLRTAA